MDALGTARQVKPSPDSISQQVIRIKRYLKCLQSQGLNAAPGVSAKATAETFVTFDVPGSTCLAAALSRLLGLAVGLAVR
jgi:hypothetical protein